MTIFCYVLTATVGGFFSGSLYSRSEGAARHAPVLNARMADAKPVGTGDVFPGRSWIRVFFLTATLWPGVVSAVTLLNNFVALYYSSSRAIHFGTRIAQQSNARTLGASSRGDGDAPFDWAAAGAGEAEDC